MPIDSVVWKQQYNKRKSAVMPLHVMATLRRVLPRCDICAGVLQEKYIRCGCGIELHVRCIRKHKKDVK